MFGKTYVFRNLFDKSMAYTRENCRKLINEGILVPKLIKGVTRHRPKKVDKLDSKTKWIIQVRKLRALWKFYKNRPGEKQYSVQYRKIYMLIKANKINTKNKLITKINAIQKN